MNDTMIIIFQVLIGLAIFSVSVSLLAFTYVQVAEFREERKTQRLRREGRTAEL
jgi:hypothetical protein